MTVSRILKSSICFFFVLTSFSSVSVIERNINSQGSGTGIPDNFL